MINCGGNSLKVVGKLKKIRENKLFYAFIKLLKLLRFKSSSTPAPKAM
jgi:hypothetical protein